MLGQRVRTDARGHGAARRRHVAGPLVAALVGCLLVSVPAEPAAAAELSEAERTVTFATGGLQPLQPARILDTRDSGATVDGQARAEGRIDAGADRALQVAGRGGVPAVGAGAVWLNITVTQPSGAGHLTVHPTGTVRPNASNLNFTTGRTAPNLVLAKLGVGGKVQLATSTGTHAIADVVGWVPESRDVQALQPARVLDTRGTGETVDGQQQRTGAFGSGETRQLPLAGRAGVPATGASAVVLNLTAVGPTRGGHLTAWPAGTAAPNASTLNFAAGSITPNLVVAKLGGNGAIALRNTGGSTSVLADVVGWIPSGAAYGALTPARVLDTRSTGSTVDGLGRAGGALDGGVSRTLQITGRGGVPSTGVGAVVLNLTGTQPTSGTHLTVFPSETSVPNASNLNLARGETRANLVVAKVGPDGAIALVSAAGSTHAIVDVVGWFPSGAATATSPSESVTMILQPGTVLGGPGDVVSATGDATTGATVVLAAGADVPTVGGHLYLPPHQQTPSGLSGRVTTVTPGTDGSTTVTLEPANLQDIFVDLVISEAFDDVADVPAAGPALRSMHLQTGEQECTPEGGASGGGSGALLGLPVLFDLEDVSGSFQLQLRAGYSRMLLRLTPTAVVDAAVTTGFSCTLSLGTIPLVAGPVVVEIGPEISISVSGAITTTLTVAAPISLGYTFDKGAVNNLSGVTLTGSATDPDGSADLTLGLAAVLSAKLGGIVGVEADLGPQAGLSVTTDGCGELKGTVSAGLSAVAERWGVGWSFELARITLAEKVLARFGDCGIPIWDGTIKTDYSYEYLLEDGRGTKHSGAMQYTDLTVTGDQVYGATVSGSGAQYSENNDGCPYTGTWTLTGTSTDTEWGRLGVLSLENHDDGVHINPYFLDIPHHFTNPCGEPQDVNTTAAGFESGRTYTTTDPLPDTDPDPRKLVGSVTYTLANPPAELINHPSSYSFTITYDLHRVDLPPA